MKTIGVLGGMSWESTAEWYQRANTLVRDRLGGFHSAPILLDSLDFAEIEQMQADGRWDDAGTLLARHARALEVAGADLIVLCTNTMHLVAPQIEAALTVPFLHLADVTAAAVREAGARTVALLGTAFTMEQAFYRDRLSSHGLTVIIPEATDRATVHSIIYDELVHGIVTESSRDAYREVIARLVQAGAEGIILGCTEIELLVREEDSAVMIFPTTALHVRAAVDAALGE